jgi:oligopeptidase A
MGCPQAHDRHVDSGAPLPRALFDKMLAAKNFQSGMQTCARSSSRCSTCTCITTSTRTGRRHCAAIARRGAQRVAVVIPPAYNRFPNNFSHIFAGGYAAGYYSYKWAEVLSADAYSLFEENGILNPRIGRRFWSEILGVGGSRDAIDSFKAFRGREPTIDALLRHNGMA